MTHLPSRGLTRAAALTLRCMLLLPAGFLDAQVPASLQVDPVDLHLLAVLSGRVLPSSATPWSGAAALLALEGLPDPLADGSSGLATEAIASLRRDDVPMVDVSFTTRFEYYVRPPQPLSFVDRLEKVDPLGTLEFSFQTGLSLALFVQATLQREYQLPDGNSNLPSPLPGNPVALENNDVQAGYLLYSPGPFEIVFGRQRFSIGPSPLTSLVVSRSVPYLDALDVALDLGRLRMTMLVSTLENRGSSGSDVTPSSPYDFQSTVILHNIHYFEYDFGFIRVGLGAQVLIIRPANAFQIADFFPVFSWHNADIIPNNLTLTLDASAVPVPGLEVYAQFGFDDINVSFVVADGSIPTITAGLVGAAWRDRWQRSSIEAVLEAGYTHYLWGSFNDEWQLARALYRLHVDGDNPWIALNSPFGPGTAWLLARSAVTTPWNFDVAATLQFLSRNSAASLLGAYEASQAVANAPRELSLVVGVEVAYTPVHWLRLTLEPVLHVTPAETWIELEIGAGTSLSSSRGRRASAER
jgi:hypothetical protein